MAYVVIAKWLGRNGEEESVRAALERLRAPSAAEPGCRFYQPTVDPQDPRLFTLIEIYDDEDAYEAHLASDHFVRFAVDRAIPLLERRDREFYETFT